MKALYSDKLVELNDEEIVFHKYYFPMGSDKHVRFDQIDRVQVQVPSFSNGKWRLWGSAHFLRTWLPLDLKRPSPDRIFLATLRSTDMRIGFTVEDDPDEVEAILKERGLLDR